MKRIYVTLSILLFVSLTICPTSVLVSASSVTSLDAEPELSFNPVGTAHTITANVTPPLQGITVHFDIDGVNSSGSGTETTDSSGVATFVYTGTHDGYDAINIWVDNNGNGAYDEGTDPVDVVEKIWLENYVTGGGKLNTVSGRKVAYSFGGTVGVVEGIGIVGQFQVVDHTGKQAEAWHIGTEDFHSMTFLGNPAGSPVASHHRAYFSGTFTSNRGNSKFLTVWLFDNDEPGAGNDFIGVHYLDEADSWVAWFGGTIEGGNIQVHDIPMD